MGHFIKCFLSRVSILTRDIDIANLSVCLSVRPSVSLSVRNVPVSDENGFVIVFLPYGSQIILVLPASKHLPVIPMGSPSAGALYTGGVKKFAIFDQ